MRVLLTGCTVFLVKLPLLLRQWLGICDTNIVALLDKVVLSIGQSIALEKVPETGASLLELT